MENIPKIITILENDLCIGCGICVYKCPSHAIEISWNQNGFLIPKQTGTCDSTGDCIDVCPFNLNPKTEIKTESELAHIFLKQAKNHHPKIGSYSGIYAGYSDEFRLSSSSGGMTTYVLSEILERKIVDYILSVKVSEKMSVHYEYTICSNKEELLLSSKTRYFPVTLGNIMHKIHELNGNVAIVGVACFIKAIRLAQYKDPHLNEKIPFLVGIICGGMKSLFFTEYLANKSGASIQEFQEPQYRIKNLESTAGDYSFGCFDKKSKKSKTIRMKLVGDMWGTGLFKANACDFCEDVTTELADISMGDAWIMPYHKDGRGTNLIVTRSKLAESIIQQGKKKEKLNIEILDIDRFLLSQRGGINHKHRGLPFRIKNAKKHKLFSPPKRFDNEVVSFDFKIVQLFRIRIRNKSLEVWKKNRNAEIFEKKMKKDLILLKVATAFYHYRKLILSKLKTLKS